MSRSSRLTLTVLAATAVGASTLLAGAQTVRPDAPAVATEVERAVTPVQFREGRWGGRGGMARRMLTQADADGDGSVTQAEIDAFLAEQVRSADADADGSLALAEFETVFAEQTRPRMVDAFQALDEDGDGQITTAEIDGRFGSIVERLDRNGDGALSADDRRRGGREGRRGRDRDGR